MGCNCKTDKNGVPLDESISNEKTPQKITSYILKFLAFVLMLVLLPIINLGIIWVMFKTLVLNENVNIKPLLLAIGKKFQESDRDGDDDEDNEFEELTEDDVEMLDVEDITNKSK